MTDSYAISPGVLSFARTGIQNFDGMLNKSAAFGAAAMARILEAEYSWENSAFLEIGVYKGKFFSLIEKATRGSDCLLVGIDPFALEDQSKDQVEDHFMQEGMEMHRIHLHKGYSPDQTAIKGAVGDRKLLLVHVDGSHKEDDVLADFLMLDEIVQDNTIIIADDFWNKGTLGVLSAISRLLIGGRTTIVPIMLCNTKLFLSRQEKSQFYQNALLESFQQNSELELFANYLDKKETQSWHHTSQIFLGHRMLVI